MLSLQALRVWVSRRDGVLPGWRQFFNPKQHQGAKMIEGPNQKGASFSPTDGSLPALRRPPLPRRKNQNNSSCQSSFLSSISGFRLWEVFLAGAVAWASRTDGSLPAPGATPSASDKPKYMPQFIYYRFSSLQCPPVRRGFLAGAESLGFSK